ncbi:MAG: RimK family alpha-L-glutamate ligase [Pseudomonadota bacterium]
MADRHPPIVIFTDDPGWHGKALKDALAAQGFASIFVSLTACEIDIAAAQPVQIPGLEGQPLGAFVRGVPGGSLEQIVQRLDVLHMLKLNGCIVFNSGRVIERTVDKSMTSLLLKQAGVAVPKTWITESFTRAGEIAEEVLGTGRNLVKKPLFGSQGTGIRLLRDINELNYALPGEIFYLQEFVARDDGQFKDLRVFVVHDQAVAAMYRESGHWVTNRAKGAQCVATVLTHEMAEIAVRAANACGASYAGVDLIESGNGEWQVLEVNGIPAWQGLQRATGEDITERLVAAFCKEIRSAVDLSA